ncbi:MAG: hypothetical protein H6806_12685 [Planctomycetes bacterium]|nr:hypothetical protein [Planctomycetota bacterium]MCB9830601.1 hypothetical protein [Planctomycetota bacterium]MCB9901176.1 hypothetical protein [Planctomycetota bacterium]
MASPEAHERAKAILLTLGGTWSVGEAMAHLGVGRTRFAELRLQLLEAVLDAMEGGVRGRPRRREDPHAELITKLEDEIAELTRLLERARAEIEILSGPAQAAVLARRGGAA